MELKKCPVCHKKTLEQIQGKIYYCLTCNYVQGNQRKLTTLKTIVRSKRKAKNRKKKRIMQEAITQEGTKIGKIAITLFAFMQQCRLNAQAAAHPSKILTYQFAINDLTNEGVPFGISFDLSTEDVLDVEDTPQAIESFCFGLTVKTGLALLTERATRLLQYRPDDEKSRIILPGQ
jgi:hypothetical protein